MLIEIEKRFNLFTIKLHYIEMFEDSFAPGTNSCFLREFFVLSILCFKINLNCNIGRGTMNSCDRINDVWNVKCFLPINEFGHFFILINLF